MALATGTSAPDFTLKSKAADGLVDVTLSDNFGKRPTVLLFFPLAFTSVCVAEMCAVNDDLQAYADLDAAVYGISVDSPFAQEVMAKENGIAFPLLSDFARTVSQAYDVLFDDFIGLGAGAAKRSAFVIDRDGRIMFSSSSDDPRQLPDFDALKAALKG